jgi:hypothetical protein
VGILGDWGSFELTFKVVDKNDPEARSTNIWTSFRREGRQGWRNPLGEDTIYPAVAPEAGGHAVQSPTIGQQLIDLQKAKDAGAITEADYQIQKAKLLEK